LVPLEVAQILNLTLTDERTSHSAAGQFKTYISDADLWIGQKNDETPIGRIPVNVPTMKIIDNTKISYLLLGRNPLFNMYDITFKESQKKLLLNPASKPPPGKPSSRP
jgi:hypothetical protein